MRRNHVSILCQYSLHNNVPGEIVPQKERVEETVKTVTKEELQGKMLRGAKNKVDGTIMDTEHTDTVRWSDIVKK